MDSLREQSRPLIVSFVLHPDLGRLVLGIGVVVIVVVVMMYYKGRNPYSNAESYPYDSCWLQETWGGGIANLCLQEVLVSGFGGEACGLLALGLAVSPADTRSGDALDQRGSLEFALWNA
eukprot:6056024-Amphidinium_carterae.1